MAISTASTPARSPARSPGAPSTETTVGRSTVARRATPVTPSVSPGRDRRSAPVGRSTRATPPISFGVCLAHPLRRASERVASGDIPRIRPASRLGQPLAVVWIEHDCSPQCAPVGARSRPGRGRSAGGNAARRGPRRTSRRRVSTHRQTKGKAPRRPRGVNLSRGWPRLRRGMWWSAQKIPKGRDQSGQTNDRDDDSDPHRQCHRRPPAREPCWD